MAGAHRALVVEDDADVRDLVVMTLELAGLEVATAGTGADAVSRARDLDPDLVTLDLSLPDADGRDVCRRIREFSDARIILVTGRTVGFGTFDGAEVDADDYLVKPFSPQALRTRATELLSQPRAPRATPIAPERPAGA